MTFRFNRWTWGILIGALALRLAAATHLDLNRGPSDSSAFLEIAHNLVERGQYALEGHLTADRLPGYTFFLAALFSVHLTSTTALLVAQALLSTWTIGLLMGIARRLQWTARATHLAGFLAALYPFFIYYSARLLTETLAIFWLVACFYCYLGVRLNPESPRKAILFGLCAAGLVLTKASFLFWLLLIFAVEAARNFRQAKALGVWTLALLVFATPTGLWIARNDRVFGSPVIDTRGGLTCLECMVFYAENKAGVFKETNLLQIPFYAPAAAMNELEQDRFYAKVYRDFIHQNPRQFMRQALANVKDFWRFYPRLDLEATRSFFWVSIAWEPWLILLGFWGLWRLRRKWRIWYALYALIVLLTAVHTVTCSQMRYRLPLMPFFILLSAYSVDSFLRRKEPE